MPVTLWRLRRSRAFDSVLAVSASIRILPDALADQIAAGEVVERPASVVKELIENAIDAGAERVTIDIEDGGLSLIRVSDDGSGMLRQDASLSVQRHATSKITSRDDLFSIRTLGFRGEALPSIASVSRFTLDTRPRSADAGTRVQVAGGAQAEISEIGCAPGTSVEVRALFYNVPARLKFLKSKPTESAHVASTCLRAALAYPELAVSLRRDGRAAHDFLAKQTLIERVATAFPDDQLRSYEGIFEGAALRAALGAPERARSGATNLHLFVNRRPVRDPVLARCVAFAYGSVLPPGRYPVGAVYLELDPSEVDVNVHPQKLEVRFARGRGLLDALTRCLAQKLGTSAWSGPAMRPSSYWHERLRPGPALEAPAAVAGGHVLPYSPPPRAAEEHDAWGLSQGAGVALADHVADGGGGLLPVADGDGSVFPVADSGWPPPPVADSSRPALLGERGFFASLRVLGQARRTFLVCEGQHGVLIIDQHAADERVRFDRLRRAYAAREVRTQRLLFPERVECTELDAALVEQQQEEFGRLGLECSRLGPSTVAVAAVPALLTRAAPERLLHDILAELTRSGERAFADRMDMALATMACHASIRAGDVLSETEQGALLRSLDAVQDFQGHCPHGRPILCTLAFDELEQRLGR
jgi:DNA mismatch repair protein MutL